MTVAIELAIVPLAELIQDFFGLVGPVLGIAIAGSIAFLFLKTSLRWFKLL